MDALLAHAATRFGLFTRRDAHDHGLNDRMLRYRTRTGVFEQLARHVFRVSGAPASWEQELLAACLAGGPSCVASHRSAAALHRFDRCGPGVIEVTVPRTVRYRRAGVIVHQSTDLAPSDCTRVGPIPVTTPERTLIDLGAVTWLDRVEEAFDGAERDRAARRDRVVQRHREVRRQGRNGVGPMAVLLDGRPAAVPQSVLERRFLRLLEQAGLPLPVCQHPVRLRDGRTVYLDGAYVSCRLAVELDGHGSHATRRQRAADHERANALADVGWHVRRFTWEQVTEQGSTVVRTVRAALTAHRYPGPQERWGR